MRNHQLKAREKEGGKEGKREREAKEGVCQPSVCVFKPCKDAL